ncbi:MAG: Radical SAM [Candidatus Beckwithbacteria bacterium GW2011_GWA2_43_10]|uniref:Radical SAM n=1 Tax=Candidatus Beckwithbacteria bacterium GW2011_GWA2_43_10 TaxID=1618369 RepID=A0A0G1BZ87_9BACT|nr:MAG: Radical SAM [Candidatus Beckwithbacteria bacterium GW2011_GWA2_43_10]
MPLYRGPEAPLISLTLDKDKYVPTDKATVSIVSEIADRDVLLTMERGRVDRTQVVHIDGKSKDVEIELKAIASDNFAVEYRSNAIQKYSEERPYKECMATPFASAHIMADGSVYSCSAHLMDQKFYLGNINKQSFREIWEGERRKEQWEAMKKFDLSGCRRNCRMDETNRYLWEVTHPPYNVNFI